MEHQDSVYKVEDVIATIIKKHGTKPSALVLILQDVQKHYGYLPHDALVTVCGKMKLPLPQVYGLATFYKSFSLTPKGEHHICVCTGTSCHIQHSGEIMKKLERDLGIKAGKTTPDGKFSLDQVECFGLCALGPAITVDDVAYSNMAAPQVDGLLKNLRTGSTAKVKETV